MNRNNKLGGGVGGGVGGRNTSITSVIDGCIGNTDRM